MAATLGPSLSFKDSLIWTVCETVTTPLSGKDSGRKWPTEATSEHCWVLDIAAPWVALGQSRMEREGRAQAPLITTLP